VIVHVDYDRDFNESCDWHENREGIVHGGKQGDGCGVRVPH
jgi:hypothetical protein